MKHEPRCLLTDTDRSGHFAPRHAVATGREHPHRREPLIETDMAIFKDRADFGGELAVALPAAPGVAILDIRYIRRTATMARASYAVWEAHRNEEVVGDLRVCELLDGFEERSRRIHVPSVSNPQCHLVCTFCVKSVMS